MDTFIKNQEVYSRFVYSRKEDILKLMDIFNGNFVLEKRQNQLEALAQIVQQEWVVSFQLKPRCQKPSLENGWIYGFLDAEGDFYTNLKNNLKKGTYPTSKKNPLSNLLR